ncbi:MAG TPA: ComF family protein [Spirochaetes bacterium]|nr:ComF family protein [Spirochaetota bacterium]
MNVNMKKNILMLTGLLTAFFFPNRCVFCGMTLKEGSCVCNGCLSGIELIKGPICAKCGAPLRAVGTPPAKSCEQCTDLPLDYNKNESLGIFTGKLRELIHLYKFKRRKSLSRVFSAMLLKHKKNYVVSHDVLMVMPLTGSKRNERGFNQSFRIAREISKKVPVMFYGDIIKRKGRSRPQSQIAARKERFSNVTDRFIVKERHTGDLRGKNILLFDDVLTTGATASACARSLYQYNVKNIDILTLARALKEPSMFNFNKKGR